MIKQIILPIVAILALCVLGWFALDSYNKLQAEKKENKSLRSKLDDVKKDNWVLIDSSAIREDLLDNEINYFKDSLEFIYKQKPKEPYYDKNIDTIRSDRHIDSLWARHFRNNSR
jgi:lipopolysaccharide export system protein LptC